VLFTLLGVENNMAQDPTLLGHAKQMRHEATPFEVILWRHLSNSKLAGFKFRRQHVIDSRIVDFFCPAKKLIVEVDGETHDPRQDARRDLQLQADGYQTLRFTNAEVANELDGVLQAVLNACMAVPDRWPQSPTHTKEAGENQNQPLPFKGGARKEGAEDMKALA
jgi:very-short-patch-repair endonuclease